MGEIEQSAGSADAEMEIIKDSWQYKLNTLKQTWVGVLQEMIDRGQINELLDNLIKISEAIGDIITAIGPLPTLIAAIGIPNLLIYFDKFKEAFKWFSDESFIDRLFGNGKTKGSSNIAEEMVKQYQTLPKEMSDIGEQASESFTNAFDIETSKNLLHDIAKDGAIFKDTEKVAEEVAKGFNYKSASEAIAKAANEAPLFTNLEDEAAKSIERINRTFSDINLDEAQTNIQRIGTDVFAPLSETAYESSVQIQRSINEGLSEINVDEVLENINNLDTGEVFGKLPETAKDATTQTIDILDELVEYNDWNWGDSVEDAIDDVKDAVSDAVDDINDTFATDIEFDIDDTEIKEGTEAVSETFKDATEEVQNAIDNVDTSELSEDIKQTGEVSQQTSAFLKGLANTIVNLGLSIAIAAIANAIIKLANAEKTLAQRAEESARAMKSAKNEIGNYRSEIGKLSQTLRDENASIEEKTEARKELYNIQRDLIDQYGKEETSVGLINSIIETSTDTMLTYEESINKVATAWENLELKAIEAAGRQSDAQDDAIQKWYNSIVYGTQSSFRANNKKYEDYSADSGFEIASNTFGNLFNSNMRNATKELNKYIEQLGGIRQDGVFSFVGKSAKETKELYEDIIAYAKSIGYENDRWYEDLKTKIDEVDNLIENTQPYRDAKAEAYIAGSSTYSDAKNFIDKKYEEYNQAMGENDTVLADEISKQIQDKLSYVEEKAKTDGKDFVADWFQVIYAEIQSRLDEGEVDKWFNESQSYQFSDEDFGGIRTNQEIIEKYIKKLGTVSSEDLYDIYSAWEDDSINNADNRWNSIAESASDLFYFLKENNVEMDKFVKLAQERNILDTQDESIAKKRFGEGEITLDNGETKQWTSQAIKDWINKLSSEDLAILLSLELDPNRRYLVSELEAEIEKAREYAKNNPIKEEVQFDQKSFSDAIGNLKSVTDAYDKWREQIETKNKIHLDITEVEQLRSLVEGIDDFNFDNFENVLTSSSSSVEEIDKAFNELYDAILKSKIPIDEINASNREMIQTQLQEAGMSKQIAQQYTNSSILRAEAEQKVTQELANELEAQHEYNETADESNRKHSETVDYLMDEAEQLGLTNQDLIEYVTEMGLANGLSITGDYSWLIELCEQIGIAIEDIYALRNLLAGTDTSSFNSEVNHLIEQAYQSGDITTARKYEQQKKQFNDATAAAKSFGDALDDEGSKARRNADDNAKAGGGAGKAADGMNDAADAANDASSAIDQLQDAYSKLKKIQESYNKTGKISVDQAQELMQMDFRYLNMLKMENGTLSLNEQAFESATQAKLAEMKITMMRNALNTMQSITTEAQAEAYLALCTGEANMATTEAVAIQAALEAQMRGATGAIAEAYNVIYQGLQNAMTLLGGEGFGNVDFSTLATSAEDTTKDIAENAEEEFEKVFDWLERRMTVLQKKADLFAAKRALADMTYFSRTSGYNYYLDKERRIYYKQLDTAKEQVKAYEEEYNKAIEGMDEATISAIEGNGNAIETITDQEMSDAIDKAIEWKDKWDDAKIKIEEVQKKINELTLEKLNFVFDLLERRIEKFQRKLDFTEFREGLIEAEGYTPSSKVYKTMSKQYKKLAYERQREAQRLEAKRTQSIKNGSLIENSEEDLEIQQKILDAQQEAYEMQLKQAEAAKQARDAEYERLQFLQQISDAYDDELQSVYGLFNADEAINDKAQYTSTAYGMMATQAYSYKENISQTKDYRKEIEKLNKKYANGKIGATEYQERLQELRSSMYASAEAAKAAKDAIVDLAKERIQKEISIIKDQIEAYNELIAKQKEELKSQKD